MKSQNLFENFQSAYSEGRSIETALLRIQNDILMVMECKQVTALIMLDLSASFDTVNHNVFTSKIGEESGHNRKSIPVVCIIPI